ncbi:MAG TPA: ABC transporter permease [Steroidobacteraceae bacterium]|nr:ABC transporter permease [Steroidobacteraceae bacterium]
MFGYYLNLALRSLRRNLALTILMVGTIGAGIGASMTTLTIFRSMSADPIPQKSSWLFTPQIDNEGPAEAQSVRNISTSDLLPVKLTYTDAVALMRARAAPRQAAMYLTAVAVSPPDSQLLPFQVAARATYRDFFPMFDVPFEYGAPWSAADDGTHAAVVVLSRKLNDRLFGGANSVGRSLRLDKRVYRVVGVADDWNPTPHFYDLTGTYLGGTEQIYLPFTRAIDQQLSTEAGIGCLQRAPGNGWQAILHSECIWIELWTELPNPIAESAYRTFLHNYADEQRASGRFSWPARVALRNVQQWLASNHVVSSNIRMLVLIAAAFLLACVLNAVALMLAKFMSNRSAVSIRRAMGANRGAIFKQCLVEAGIIGVAGGALGLGLTLLGLLIAKGLFSGADVGLTRLDGSGVAMAELLSVGATLLAGLYPGWRTARVQPAWHLKVQ